MAIPNQLMVRRTASVALAVLAGAVSPASLRGQTATDTNPPANRYLIIIETSRPMRRRSEAVFKVVQDLLTSGMRGQLHAGDTLGLWTFNETVYAGRFPLQECSAASKKAVSSAVLSFIKSQKYEKQARFDDVWPEIDRVVTDSDFLTLLLISSGDAPVRGTPFDGPINQYYATWHDAQQKARTPFVTVLRARHGKITDYSVGSAPWPVEMPPLPPEFQVAKTAGKKPPLAPIAAPAPVPPLIVIGKKPVPPPPPSLPGTPNLSVSNQSEQTIEPSLVSAASAPPAETRLAPSVKQTDAAPTIVAVQPTTPPMDSSSNFQSQPAGRPSSGAPPSAVESTVVTPPAGWFSNRVLWGVAAVVGLAIVAFLIAARRRSRGASQASLISRSLERPEK